MNLDDIHVLNAIDSLDMLGEINRLPEQLNLGWEAEGSLPKGKTGDYKAILIGGMGGSAIGADLLATYIAPFCKIPVYVHRNYGLPAWVDGSDVLVIASSHSGNTEETLNVFQQAILRQCSVLSVCTGGELEAKAIENHVPIWKFSHTGQPRGAAGFSFSILLKILFLAKLIPNQDKIIKETYALMKEQQEELIYSVPVAQNSAKKLAGQFLGRHISIFGSDYLTPVSRRWKTQINEIAKTWASFEFLPEADHNTAAGNVYPEEAISKLFAFFLNAPTDHPRNQLRSKITRESFLVAGVNTDSYLARGQNPMPNMWTALHFGDYVSYYLAIAYGVDPTRIESIEFLKKSLKNG
jgi:glucose/mannose-6-phosphate isomerase